MGKLAKIVKDNIDIVVSAVGAVGLGACVAAFSDVGEMLREHTVGALLLVAVSFSLGYLAASLVLARSRWAKRRAAKEEEREAQRQKLARLERVFASMPKRRREIVAQALDEGSVHLSSFDSDARTLCDLRVLGMSSVAGATTGADFSVQPSVVLEVREHRAEWLGM